MNELVFRRFWSARINALERYLDRMDQDRTDRYRTDQDCTDQSARTKRRKNPMESTLQQPALVAAKTTPKGITRSIFRWIHIVFAIPILGYIYSPFDKIPSYAFRTRFVFVPIMVLSGLWMWKGHVVRRLLSKRPA
jgi:hypothetical protein